MSILLRDGRRYYATALTIALVASLATVDAATAQGTGGGALAPLENTVNFLVDFITGPFGRAIAILAIISLGFLAFIGRITVVAAFLTVLGIALIFGAPQIVDAIQGAAA